ncbi:MAG: 50S ribosomal protein L40e [Candidatus Woesearchaeota archaeon]
MVKFPEAEARLFHGKFVCKKCKSTIKAPIMKILAGKIKCKRCRSSALRPMRKK